MEKKGKLKNVPEKLIWIIFSFSDVISLTNLSSTNKSYKEIVTKYLKFRLMEEKCKGYKGVISYGSGTFSLEKKLSKYLKEELVATELFPNLQDDEVISEMSSDTKIENVKEKLLKNCGEVIEDPIPLVLPTDNKVLNARNILEADYVNKIREKHNQQSIKIGKNSFCDATSNDEKFLCEVFCCPWLNSGIFKTCKTSDYNFVGKTKTLLKKFCENSIEKGTPLIVIGLTSNKDKKEEYYGIRKRNGLNDFIKSICDEKKFKYRVLGVKRSDHKHMKNIGSNYKEFKVNPVLITFIRVDIHPHIGELVKSKTLEDIFKKEIFLTLLKLRNHINFAKKKQLENVILKNK